MSRFSLGTMAIAVVVALGCARQEQLQFVTIGTGGVTGVYYPVGGAITKVVNQQSETYGIRASVESTGGSVYNINAVLQGDLELGIAQSDRQAQAWNGNAEWEGKPQSALRAVFSLHPEIITLVATEASGIRSLADLRGKRVNIGNPGSGQRGNALDVLAAAGIDWQTDLSAEQLKAADCAKVLQDGGIDAFFYTVGHPNGAMLEVSSGKNAVRFVPLTGLDQLLAERPYYTRTRIPVALYPKAANEGDVESIGMVTTVVGSEAVPADVIYAVTREVFEQLDTFRALHPALANLEPSAMLQGHAAPFHEGALRYYREQKLLPE